MADFGNIALMLALALAAYGTVMSFFAAHHARERFRRVAVRAYLGVTLLVFSAIFSLGYLLQTDNFGVVYVQQHSNVTLPWFYKLTALWGGSQGSLLWWTMILTVFTCFFLGLTRKAPRLMISWAMVFVGIALVFFLIINNLVANPFHLWHQISPGQEPLAIIPRDGTGLNPQLQHWAMIIHPPLLYTGYIGFLFPFAMAMGALITRLEGREWIRLIRRWTLTAWLILGVGIILGGAWAYMELGWGGYWAWDPVENASFMPWLLATAFLHSVMAQEQRGMFKLWNILLLVGTFLMCMFGTFITRSGLISSVHSFAKSSIGWYFIAYIALHLVISIAVLIYHRDQLVDDNAIDSWSSREVGLLFNNVLFIAISVTMLMATVYPMLTEAIYDVKRELRHGFYNIVELPIFLGILVLMAMGPILTWKRTSKKRIRERFFWPAIALVVAGILGFVFNHESVMANFSFAAIAFLLTTIVQEYWTAGRTRAQRAGENFLVAVVSITRMNRRRYGGYVTHFAVLLIAIGLTGAAFNRQAKEELAVGQVMEVGGYTFQVASIETRNTPNYLSLDAKVNLLDHGKVKQTFHPEQRLYHASQSQASEVAIGSNLARDYYVVLAGPGEGSTAEHPIGVFHVYVNPLVVWIWAGGILMIFGTVICMLPESVRQTSAVTATAPAVGETV